jgi:N-acetylated-alpha-linked acidic dipeptidase
MPAAIKDLLAIVKAPIPDTNAGLVLESRRFMREEGIPGRVWFKNWYVATDENSGYATWVLPGFRKAIEDADQKAFDEAVGVYADILRR